MFVINEAQLEYIYIYIYIYIYRNPSLLNIISSSGGRVAHVRDALGGRC
jgi:hypothetical protein